MFQQIALLNEAAKANKRTGMETYEALEKAAHDAGFSLLQDGEDCSVYVNKQQQYVNMWHHADEIADGASGFDDQYEWAIEANDN